MKKSRYTDSQILSTLKQIKAAPIIYPTNSPVDASPTHLFTSAAITDNAMVT